MSENETSEKAAGLRDCSDFPDAPSCCDSCHEDADLGYPMCEFDHAVVCCVVRRWCDEHARRPQ